MLPLLVSLPLLGSAACLVSPARSAGRLSVFVSALTFALSLLLWVLFDNLDPRYQFCDTISWFGYPGVSLRLGLDGVSLFLVLLTTLLTPVCLAGTLPGLKKNPALFAANFLFMEALLIAAFSALDLIAFYAFFEGILIPMFLLIGTWGSRSRRSRAAYYLFYYTLVGSIFMLIGILYVYSELGTTCVYALHAYDFSLEEQSVLWLLFFVALAVKVPIVPLHVWLPEAHVEAPTSGSVILAGVLLKLGGYGLIRFVLPVFPQATSYYAPLVMTIASVSIVYSSLTTLRQVDLKKIIAYSSVAHMNLGLLGVFSLNLQGLEGSVLLMIGHGLVSSALFLLVGVLYDRHHTRLVRYYGGLAQVMPAFSGLFLAFSLANMGLPGTGNFVGEALVLVGAYDRSPGAAFAAAWGMVFSAGYSLWLYNRVSLGSLKVRYITRFVDLTKYELSVLSLLLVLTIVLGVYPSPVLSALHVSVSAVLRV